MRTKQPLATMMLVAGTDYVLNVHSFFNGSLPDPGLTLQALGQVWVPQAICVQGSGSDQRILYRWWVDAGLVTLTIPVVGITGRHAHRPLFTVAAQPAVSKAKPEVSLQPHPPTGRPRQEVWRQELPKLASAIRQTQQLHRQIHSLLTALPSDDV
jgi:hypothetical protein